MISREDAAAADVFARLGAGTQDPVPGGAIREWNGRPKVSNPLNCTHVVEGHNNSVLAVKVNDNSLYTAAAGNSPQDHVILASIKFQFAFDLIRRSNGSFMGFE